MTNRSVYFPRLTQFTIGLLPVLVGGIIYLAFRPMSLRMFAWANYIHFDGAVAWLRSGLGSVSLPNWVIFTLPGGLWLFSFQMVILMLWRFDLRRAIVFIAPIWLMALGSELGQLLGLLPGHFDFTDIVAYMIAILSAIFVVVAERNRRKINTI